MIPFAPIAIAAGLAAGTPLVAAAQWLIRGETVFGWRSRVVSALSAAVLFAEVALCLAGPLEIVGFLLVACGAVVLALVDVAEKRLPNLVVVPLAATVALVLACSAALRGDLLSAVSVVVGGIAMFLVYLVMALFPPGGVGMGDVKLALVVGAACGYLGLTAWLVGLVAAVLIGALVSLLGLAIGRLGRSSLVPFGPSMLAGCFVALATAYLR